MPKSRKFVHLLTSLTNMPRKFYAVREGRNTGVYNSWSECEAQVNRYPGAVYKSFQNHSDAHSFVNTEGGYGGRAGSGSSNYGRSCVSNARETYSGNFAGGGARHYSSRSNGGGSRSYCDDTSRPVVHVDGSCFGNGYRGATAGVGVYWGPANPHNVSEKLQGNQTNQRAELTASCRAIESAIAQGHPAVEIRTDSQYTIKAATEWTNSWKQKNWKTSTGSDVKNREDIERLDDLCGKVDVKWTHVRGHTGIPGNEAADGLAKAGSMKN